MNLVIKQLLLVAIAVLYKWFLFIFAIPYTIIKSYWLLGWSEGNKQLAEWLKEIAITQDRLANAMYKEPLNDLLIYPDEKVSFGNGKETISKVLGKANQYQRFKKIGYKIAKALNILDKNHIQKAVLNQ